MAVPEYAIFVKTDCFREKGPEADDAYGVAEKPASAETLSAETALLEELDRLRRLLVRLYEQGLPFSDELVIEISRVLDQKINEYMIRKRSR